MARTKLSAREAAFLAEYLVDRNGARAARAAGYSQRHAKKRASVLLGRPIVQAALAAATQAVVRRQEFTRDAAVAELRALAFSRIRHIADWAGGVLRIRDAADIPDEAHAAIREIKATEKVIRGKDGEDVLHRELSVKLHDKLPALLKVAKHMGLDMDEPDGDDGPPLGSRENPFVIISRSEHDVRQDVPVIVSKPA